MEWEAVIGLEIHVQLATQSKIFSGASTQFGAAANTQACAVDLGLPGVLPVVNEEATRMAILFGLAIDAEIDQKCVFARKNYFYPDLPKGYQISQLDRPIVGKGSVTIRMDGGTEKVIGVTRAHLEEDAGKSLHEDFHGMTGIDLNRAGTPLLEIVSEPDLRSAKEAVAYLKAIHAIVTTLGVSDGDMSQGSMRCDANVSVRIKGDEKLGTRAEIKNINSFRFVERAINHEIERQIDIIENGGAIVQETRLYDSDKNETRSMRSKEEANDYRYFPDPDLLPLDISDETVAELRAQLPELPEQKRVRFQDEYALNETDASILSADKHLAAYFETLIETVGKSNAKLAANWTLSELMGYLNKHDISITDAPIEAVQMGLMLKRILDNTISGKSAKTVFEAMWNQEGTADEIIEARDLKQESDTGAIDALVDDVIANSPEQVQQYLSTPEDKRKRLIGYFVGQVMKASKGKANPQQVNAALAKKLVAKD